MKGDIDFSPSPHVTRTHPIVLLALLIIFRCHLFPHWQLGRLTLHSRGPKGYVPPPSLGRFRSRRGPRCSRFKHSIPANAIEWAVKQGNKHKKTLPILLSNWCRLDVLLCAFLAPFDVLNGASWSQTRQKAMSSHKTQQTEMSFVTN